MGCDSNLPDYRSANGFWKQYPPLVKAGVTMKVSVTTNKNNSNHSNSFSLLANVTI